MPRRRNEQRQHRNVEQLDAIAEGQQQRTVLEDTRWMYIAKCRVMTRILNEFDGVDGNGDNVRELALELDQHGDAIEHTGTARGVYRLNLPMLPATVKLLFAAISVDTSLPKKRRRDREDVGQEVAMNDMEENVDRLNPASNLQTVSAQTYQNYKSALKWWHKHHDPVAKGKVASEWPAAVEEQINQQIASYKRDVGLKKRRGIMRQKEGKSAYNLTGYKALCNDFNQMHPTGHHFGWMEGVFAQLFTKLSVNTIGCLDNIDDLLLQNVDWENDALTIVFGNTKSDIEGESTADKKRLYANPFLTEICVIKQCKTNRSRAAKVINVLVTFAITAGKIRNQREVVVGNSTEIFDFAFGEFMHRAYPANPDKRGLDLTVCAVYERWRKLDNDHIQNNHPDAG